MIVEELQCPLFEVGVIWLRMTNFALLFIWIKGLVYY